MLIIQPKKQKELGKIISFDVNYRSDIFASESQAVLMVSIENLEVYKTAYTEVASDKLVQTFQLLQNRLLMKMILQVSMMKKALL